MQESESKQVKKINKKILKTLKTLKNTKILIFLLLGSLPWSTRFVTMANGGSQEGTNWSLDVSD